MKLKKREAYAIDYVSKLLERYKKAANLDESTFVSGCGYRKSIQQKQYQEMQAAVFDEYTLVYISWRLSLMGTGFSTVPFTVSCR